MFLEKKLDSYWKLLESKYNAPKYVGKVKDLKSSQLKKQLIVKMRNF